MSDGPVLDGNISKRKLQFFWLVDCSGSMQGKKIATLNQSIRESIPEIKNALQNHAQVEVFMRSIMFSNTASWHIGPDPVLLENFTWKDISASGSTAAASAIEMLNNELDMEKMGTRGLPPVCILLSDGYCTEDSKKYDNAIAALDKLPWGKKAVRLVIAIGDESDYDAEQLLKFTNHKEVGLLKASNPGQLTTYIKWASVTASISSTLSKSRSINDNPNDPGNNVNLPPPPDLSTQPGSGEVF